MQLRVITNKTTVYKKKKMEKMMSKGRKTEKKERERDRQKRTN